MPAKKAEAPGHGSVEEIRNKIQNLILGEESLLPKLLVPTGSVLAFSSNSPPNGWLNCNGQEVSREEHADLFSVIGTTCGSGDGSTTFNLPNLSGNFMGATAGAETHTLTMSKIPIHSHTSNATGSSLGPITANGLNTTSSSPVKPNLYAAPVALSIDSASGDGPHNNMQPLSVLNYIIKC